MGKKTAVTYILQRLTEMQLVLALTLFITDVYCRQTGTLFTVGELIKSFANNNIGSGGTPLYEYMSGQKGMV